LLTVTEQVRLSLRVPVSCVDEYESAIVDRFGVLHPYAGTELESELREFSERGSVGRLHDNITALLSRFENNRCKKKTRDAGGGETTVVQYRLTSGTRGSFMETAKQDDRNPGAIVGDLMSRYATDGDWASRESERVARVIDQLRDRSADGDDSPARKIAEQLDEPFRMDDVDDAILDAGYTSVRYAREQYLADVLDITGTTWHPNNPDVFISVSAATVPDAGDRDPRSKPYVLMSEPDKRAAILTECRDVAADCGAKQSPSVTVSEMRSALHERPQPQTVLELADEIADARDGWSVKEKSGWNHPRLRPPIGWPSDTDAETNEPERDADEIEQEATSELEMQAAAEPVGMTDGGDD
jgi:hypothetical protein